MRKFGTFTASLSAYAHYAFDWWAGELLGLFPLSVRTAFEPASDCLILYYDDGQFRRAPRGRSEAQAVGDAPSAAGSSNGVEWPLCATMSDLPSGRVTVWLPHAACLERHFKVPVAAAPDLERIVRLELERATPFKLAEIVSAYVAIPDLANRAMLSVRQFIAKRESIDAVQDKLREAGIRAQTITCLDQNNERPLPINFLTDDSSDRAGKSSLIPGLVAVALLLIAASAAAAVLRSERALSELEARLVAARNQWQTREVSAKQALAKRDQVNAIAALKGKYAPTVISLYELTHRLPDDVHLSEFKVVGGTVVIGGLGRDTSRLIPLLEGSDLFTNVEMAAPVTIDPATDKERFSIRFVLRPNIPSEDERAGEAPL